MNSTVFRSGRPRLTCSFADGAAAEGGAGASFMAGAGESPLVSLRYGAGAADGGGSEVAPVGEGSVLLRGGNGDEVLFVLLELRAVLFCGVGGREAPLVMTVLGGCTVFGFGLGGVPSCGLVGREVALVVVPALGGVVLGAEFGAVLF